MNQSPKAKTFNFSDTDSYSTDHELPEPIDGQHSAEEPNDQGRPNVGEPFIPYKQFHVLPIPDSMLRDSELPSGAKIVYGRLCRFAGKKSWCWPKPESIGIEVGLGERQIQKYLTLLERKRFIRRQPRFGENGEQTSNRISLLWHHSFDIEDSLLRDGERRQTGIPGERAKKLAGMKERLSRLRAATTTIKD